MKVTEEAVTSAQEEIGSDLAAGVGNDEDQRKIIRAALEAAMPFMEAE